jgi:hypothetical protein
VLVDAANRGAPVLDVRRYSRFGRQLRGILERSLQKLSERRGLTAAAVHRAASAGNRCRVYQFA